MPDEHVSPPRPCGKRPDRAPVVPLLLPATDAAALCGRSRAAWWRDHAAARIPAPVKLGARTMWRVEELRSWIEAGCPDRRSWEAMRTRNGGAR